MRVDRYASAGRVTALILTAFVLVVLILVAPTPITEGAIGVRSTHPDDEHQSREAIARSILEGVETLAKPGVPGPVHGLSPQSVVLATGASGGIRLPVAVATPYERGRIVAFGHGGYLSKGALGTGDTGRLIVNSVRWLRGAGEAPVLCVDRGDVADVLDRAEIPVERITWRALRTRLRSGEVPEASAWVFEAPRSLDDADIARIRERLRAGTGLLTSHLGWGWLQLNPGKSLTREHPANRLLGAAGVVYGDGYLGDIRPATAEESLALSVTDALVGLVSKALTGDALRRASGVVENALRAVSLDDRHLLPRVREALADLERESLVPTEKRPIRPRESRRRLALLVEFAEANERAARGDAVTAAPSAEDFPGDAEAESVTRTVAVDFARGGWHSTGLYARPGQPIEIRVEDAAAPRELWVRIGCHSDRLWGKPNWKRHPEIALRRRCGSVTTVTSPHGGLVYLEGLVQLEGKGGDTTVTVDGAIPAPHFVLGRDRDETWRAEIRNHPAPWAELETGKIVLSVPSHEIRDLENPTALMIAWDLVLDCYAALGMRPLPKRPERIVADRQISAGYMHSGYPIMTHLDAAARMVDLDTILGRPQPEIWGLWHELGHNHQKRDWTFGGTGEVTCNLFTLFVLDRMSGVTPIEHSRFGKLPAKVERHVERGAPFAEWKRDPFLALWMYVQLQDAFGWQLFQDVFAEYRDLSKDERPKTDDEKRDQWLVRLSRRTGKNLGPFFEAWGVPTSDAARAAVANLEEWRHPLSELVESEER